MGFSMDGWMIRIERDFWGRGKEREGREMGRGREEVCELARLID